MITSRTFMRFFALMLCIITGFCYGKNFRAQAQKTKKMRKSIDVSTPFLSEKIEQKNNNKTADESDSLVPVEVIIDKKADKSKEDKQTEQFLKTLAPEKSDDTALVVQKKAVEQRSNKLTSLDLLNEPFEIRQEVTEPLVPSDEEELVEFNFENVDLTNILRQIEDMFEVTFISDEILKSVAPSSGQQSGVTSSVSTPAPRSLTGNIVSFKTNSPLTRKKAWDLFVTFVYIAGFAVVEYSLPNTYRIVPIDVAAKMPLKAYIGVDYETLPDNDEFIRYVYFVDNTTLTSVADFVNGIRSAASSFILLQEHKAFVLTDKSSNIRSIMNIVKELDKVTMPEVVTVMQLKEVDASEIETLYNSIMSTGQEAGATTPGAQLFGNRKSATTRLFPEGTRIITYKEGNKIILLGQKDKVKQIEEFILKYLDVAPTQSYSPFFIYPLRYADAVTVANIMNEVTKFGGSTVAGKSGGIRGKDQFMRPMNFVPEAESNRLIIKGHYEDFEKVKSILDQLDEAQPQVGIEVLLLNVNLDKAKSLGAQIRSKTPGGPNGLLGNNIKFQTSGLFANGTSAGIVQNTAENAVAGVDRLLGNILSLVSGATPGNTILSLGSDLFGVWGVFQILETVSNAQVISNPFLIATNKVPARVSLGEERRVLTATIVGTSPTNAFGADQATLTVMITPQINSDGMIVLEVEVVFDDFIDAATTLQERKNLRLIKTNAIVADKQVLAIGGLMKNKTISNQSKVPILGDIPILGNLFKNTGKEQVKQDFLVLISAHIIAPHEDRAIRAFTDNHLAEYQSTLGDMQTLNNSRDPIDRMFFKTKITDTERLVEDFLFKRRDEFTQEEEKRKKNRSRFAKRGKKEMIEEQKEKDQEKETGIEPLLSAQVNRPVEKKDQPEKNTRESSLFEAIKTRNRTTASLSQMLSNQKTERKA